MLINRNSAQSSQPDDDYSFPHKPEPFKEVLSKRFRDWVFEYTPLMEACCVAVSAHLLAFPLVWCAGWALPWPKSPEISIVIEYDLTHFLELGPVPKGVTDIYEGLKHGRKKK